MNAKLTALVTGASSGIGMATARLFAQKGIRLILCGRREERLQQLTNELQNLTSLTYLVFDVSDKDRTLQQIQNLPPEWQNIDILVNNAGNAHGLAPTHLADLTDWELMMDVNVKGLMYVSKAVIPQMVKRQSGHIVNISSIAGKEVYPNGNGYCASKFAVDALSKAMRLDLNPYNIKVTTISPGMVETEFSVVRFKGDAQKAQSVYKGFKPLTAQDIADTIYYAVSCPAHVQIADLVVFPTAQASSTLVKRNNLD